MKAILITFLFVSISTNLRAQSLLKNSKAQFSKADLSLLSAAKIEESFQLTGLSKTAKFKRINLYSNISKTILFDNTDQKTLQASGRLFFISLNPSEKLAFSYDPKNKNISGYLYDNKDKYQFSSDQTTQYKLNFEAEQKYESFDCLNDNLKQWELDFSKVNKDVLPKASNNPKQNKGSPSYQAHISVDTDNEFLWKKFQNNSASAINWIEDLFLNLNVIYESELDMRLVIASTFLRIDTTPSGNPDFNADPDDFNNSLNTFTNYWSNNFSQVDRVQSMLISGKNISNFSFSGVAWVNSYCNNNFSYSYNRLGANFPISSAALFIGHELGHNFGSSHTHCEQLANGGNDFVDHCYANEFNQCYSGPTSCPGAGSGTMMSYCHAPQSGFDGNGPAAGPPSSSNCDTSSDIHPLIATKISDLIQSKYPACIKDLGYDFDTIFSGGFE